MEEIDYTAAVSAINELHRRAFKVPVPLADWAAYDSERDLNIQMLNDGDIEDMDGWVMTREDINSFVNENWVLRDREGDAARLSRADGSDIYISPVSDSFITWLDRA